MGPFKYRLSILMGLLLSTLFLTFFPKPSEGKEVAVELVWNYGNDAWVQVEIREGIYTLTMGEETLTLEEGAKIQLGATGFAPIIRISNEPFRFYQAKGLKLISKGQGVFRILTPDQTQTSYRGNLLLSWEEENWKLINQLAEEEYLKGVVPIEMSNEWASRGFEALKAQAIAARTYMVKYSVRGGITDSPNIHQAYLGRSVEGAASQAVEATQGEILVDEITGLPIDVFYSSHNGGYSEETQNVWQNPDPHYKARPDPFSLGFGGAVANWTFLISAPRLGEVFNLGPIRKIKLDKLPSGRVKMVRMEDWNGKALAIRGRTFVQKFYPFGQSIQAEAFLGSLFEVKFISTYRDAVVNNQDRVQTGSIIQAKLVEEYPAEQSNPAGPRLSKIVSSQEGLAANPQPYGVYIFDGKGWGHGVGMSQWGAYHMAQLGYSYKDILKFYYDKALITKTRQQT